MHNFRQMLKTCQNLDKTNDRVLRKRQDRGMDGWIDGQSEGQRKPILQDSLGSKKEGRGLNKYLKKGGRFFTKKVDQEPSANYKKTQVQYHCEAQWGKGTVKHHKKVIPALISKTLYKARFISH